MSDRVIRFSVWESSGGFMSYHKTKGAYLKDGGRGFFHGFFQVSAESSEGVSHAVMALVELANTGEMIEVPAKLIQFEDGKS